MRALLCLVLLQLVVASVWGGLEMCHDAEDCSEEFKSDCRHKSDDLKAWSDDRLLKLGCRYGICVCYLEFTKNPGSATEAAKED